MRLNEIMAENLSTIAHGGVYPDWVELHNPGATAVNLAAWSLSDDGNPRKYVFPNNATLAAGAYLVVWCDSLTNAPGLHSGFALGRNGESVFLYDPQTNRIDAATYGLQLPDYSVGRVSDEDRLAHGGLGLPMQQAYVHPIGRIGPRIKLDAEIVGFE